MKLITHILKFIPQEVAYAHCDIPCGIYDVHGVQMAAHTIIRMTQMLKELEVGDTQYAEHDIARITHVKEEHGGIVEDEIGTLENDYFKPDHYKKFPELSELLKTAVKLSIKTRQVVSEEDAQKLLDTVIKIAEIFYNSKDLKPVRVPSGYPTGGEIVMHK